MFAPLFDAVREALIKDPLLPSFDGGYVPAPLAKLARTQDIREVFSPEQVALRFGGEVSAWLTGDITQDRAPEIRQYVMRELGIPEVTPVTLVTRLSQSFLEAQPDEWVLRLYEFLSGQETALRRRLDTIPLIRLANGSHVVARENGKSFSETLSMEREGIPAEMFLAYINKLRIPSIRVFQMFNIPKSTATHKIRTGGRFLGTAALAAIRLEKMLSMADRIVSNSLHPGAMNFDTGQWLGEWIERPQPALGGLKPSELLDTETGAQRVFQVLAAVESGSYQ